MTDSHGHVRRYDIAKTPQGAYRTWMAASGRFVFAESFETLLRGLRFVEWQASTPGHTVEVYLEFRSVVAEFLDGAPYALFGGPVGEQLEVHDPVLGIDATAATMLDLERQVWHQFHLGRLECPPKCGRIELVYGVAMATHIRIRRPDGDEGGRGVSGPVGRPGCREPPLFTGSLGLSPFACALFELGRSVPG